MRLGLCYEGFKVAIQGSLAHSTGGAQGVANACCCSRSADCCIRPYALHMRATYGTLWHAAASGETARETSRG